MLWLVKPMIGTNLLCSIQDAILHRNMVDFVLDHPVARAHRNWLSVVRFPDENFYSTLATVRVAAGRNGGDWLVSQDVDTDTLNGEPGARFAMFNYGRCSGSIVHKVCNFGMAELKMVRP